MFGAYVVAMGAVQSSVVEKVKCRRLAIVLSYSGQRTLKCNRVDRLAIQNINGVEEVRVCSHTLGYKLQNPAMVLT